MKIRLAAVFSIFVLFGPFGTTHAQVLVRDLSGVIDNGTVGLLEATGTGASSGTSVEGYLENRTEREVHINVYLSKALFLVNRGKGQNMIASQVYHGDGAYRSDGKQSFITLKPRKRSRVAFVAYCVDFEKDNPSTDEVFNLGAPPPSLKVVMSNITNYARINPQIDITIAAQVAVWLAQGQSPKQIAERLKFAAQDEQLARSFLR